MPNPIYFNAEFSSSAHKLSQLPDDSLAEVAFAGRSNAGKSSAINVITNNRKLARISKTPGRTQLINHFTVRPNHYLVDLPGYGYAKVPKAQRQHWEKTLGDYLITREPLRCLVVVMDIRHPLTDHDWNMIKWSQMGGVALHCLLTKSDKLNRGPAQQALMGAKRTLEQEGVDCTLQLFSALRKTGVDDAHELLDMYLADEHTPADPERQKESDLTGISSNARNNR